MEAKSILPFRLLEKSMIVVLVLLAGLAGAAVQRYLGAAPPAAVLGVREESVAPAVVPADTAPWTDPQAQAKQEQFELRQARRTLGRSQVLIVESPEDLTAASGAQLDPRREQQQLLQEQRRLGQSAGAAAETISSGTSGRLTPRQLKWLEKGE